MPDPSRRRRNRLFIALALVFTAGCAHLPDIQTEEEHAAQQLAEQARQAARPSKQCSGKQGSPFSYRKKLLVLPLAIARPTEAADLPDLYRVWTRALQARLQATDRFLLKDGSAYRIDPAREVRSQVQALAHQNNAQFVVTGDILGLGIERGSIPLGPLGKLPHSGNDSRVASTAIQIYDGSSGELLKQLDHMAEIKGAVDHDGSPVAEGAFLSTPLGTGLAPLIQRQSDDIEDELACLPMQANILRADLREVHIDAGFTSNLVPGDRLRAYLRRQWSVTPDGRIVWHEESPGEVVIKKVMPETAVGLLDAEAVPTWRDSGSVRAW